jgi:hypothetical protein
MKTHPQIQARFLTHIDIATLLEVADSSAFRRKSERLLRAMILIELAYRLRMRGPWVAPGIWNIVFEHDAPPPPGLCSPSEAFPHECRWAGC